MLFCLGWLWTSTGQDAHFELGSDAMAVTAQLLDLEDFRLFLDQSHRISLGAQGCGVLRIGNQFEGPQVVQASRSFRVCLAWVQSLPAAVVNLVLDGRHWPRFWRDERRSFHSWATGWRSQGTEGTRMLRVPSRSYTVYRLRVPSTGKTMEPQTRRGEVGSLSAP